MPPKVHPIYGCTWGSFIEPFSGTSGGRARRARRALVRARGGTRHALSGVLSPSVYMGVDVVGTACEGSDNTVLGRCSSTGGLGVLVEIGVVWASDKQR